jgi:hypothetical protein
MEDKTLSLYLSRILSGFYIFIYNEKKYKLVYPDIHIKYEAEIYAQEEYDKNKYNEWIAEEDIVYFLIDLGMWTFDGENKLIKLETDIENIKIDLYKSFLNPTKQKTIRKQLGKLRNQYNNLYNIRHSLDHITLEGYCNSIKNDYILSNSIYNSNEDLVFSGDNVDTFLLKNISNYLSQNSIDITSFKKIARSGLWRNYWSANKHNLFDKPVINWTDEQKTLVVLTKMYDSVAEHPESPPDMVIEDDDMLEGWMISQRRENEKEKNKKRNEKLLPGKLNNAHEIFLMASSKEEAKNIYSMNDQQSMGIIQERKNILSKGQNIKEQNLPDVQRDLILQSNEKRKQMRKS